ncbi:hypothetical protein ACG5V6_17135 [Streptomyces chitinivorans]|uniref:Uncharacterized protein n=1 Tax=Streptomyces chitinivorans TaxID=1257027 RepID=A0ABW7HWH9_9ACTN|nr:hypothetical protein [Streptomyces chitinivorans]MDH2410551.1 hypothetical protein [Streptomyces chitinivorans]
MRDGLPPLEAARRAELEGLPPGARMDVAGPFGEMVAYHGGPPDCHA